MKRPIRLLQVAKSSGGVGMYTRRLVAALSGEKYRITVVCLAEGADEMAHELSHLDGVQAVSIPMKDHIELWSDFRVYLKLVGLIRGEKFDLIHAHTSKPGFLARLAAVGTGIPVIYQPANFAFHDGVSRRQALFYAALERFAARYLTHTIIAVCDGERELARRYSVGSDSQFVTIRSGIDPHPFQQNQDRSAARASLGIPASAFLAGTVARLTEAKAPADFIHAAARVHAVHPAAHFAWIGDGSLMDETRALVKAHGMQDVFHFTGFRADVPSLLGALDCFVLSSHWEGFPLALLEAMASGLPVVSTRVMGATEAVQEGVTGFLVPIGDIDALANAICKLIEEPALRLEFGKMARQRVMNEFTQSQMVDRIQDLYESVLRAKADSRNRII